MLGPYSSLHPQKVEKTTKPMYPLLTELRDIEKNYFRDLDNSSAKTAKASSFTGAQASKKLKNVFFRKLADISESNV